MAGFCQRVQDLEWAKGKGRRAKSKGQRAKSKGSLPFALGPSPLTSAFLRGRGGKRR